ncbi:co-chaperone GroES [Salinicoccus bachuensis]|uniref:Co-chaperonin GroES n=1 Tax=Salinicoccus bachuensis TaxID=3136731 RepID=A0ABZ3CG98_9STAP
MLKPLGNRVVIDLTQKEETTTKSGIILTESAKEKPQEGTVVAVGPGKVLDNGNRVELEVKEGDRVVYSKFAGTELKHDDKDYLVLADTDILAVIE